MNCFIRTWLRAAMTALILLGVADTALAQSKTSERKPRPASVAADDLRERFGPAEPFDFDDNRGFVSLFDGTSLAGWNGDPRYWRAEAGQLVGAFPDNRQLNNTYIVYRKQRVRDFDLKLEIWVESGGSGIQYRSVMGGPWRYPVPNAPPPRLEWMMSGPQADMWPVSQPALARFTGQVFMENSRRGIVAFRGQATEANPSGGRPRIIGRIGDPGTLGQSVTAGWNRYEIVARGPVVMHFINGQLMAVFVDDKMTTGGGPRPGYIGIELEGQSARVNIRNIWLRTIR